MTLGSLYLEAQGCVPLLLENLLGMSCPEFIGPCVVLGFSVSMEAFDELLSINVPESGVPWNQGLDLSLLLPVIGLIFTVASKLLLLYSTIDKTSMLKKKSFSTVKDTQKDSQSYIEKRRGRWELEVTQMR